MTCVKLCIVSGLVYKVLELGLPVSDNRLVSGSLGFVLTCFYPYFKGLNKVMEVCLILKVAPLTAGIIVYFVYDLHSPQWVKITWSVVGIVCMWYGQIGACNTCILDIERCIKYISVIWSNWKAEYFRGSQGKTTQSRCWSHVCVIITCDRRNRKRYQIRSSSEVSVSYSLAIRRGHELLVRNTYDVMAARDFGEQGVLGN